MNYTLVKSKKWKNISNILKGKGFQKKETQCRQRYINHLAPSLDKNQQISADQLHIFYQKYEELGPKWTVIQRYLPRKSQVQLKNIFYGNIRCFVKKVIKYFTNKTAVFVNRLDTFTLQNIYSGKRRMTFMKADIKKMNYRFDQDKCIFLIESQRQSYAQFFKALLEEDETKKSKHFDYFRKINLKNFITGNVTKSGSKNSNEIMIKNQVEIPRDQQEERENSNRLQFSDKNQLCMQFPVSNFQIYNWSENQYINVNSDSLMGMHQKLEPITIYQSEMNFYYPNYLGYPVYIHKGQYDNFSF